MPFVRPEIVIGLVEVDAVDHDDPPFVEYWYDVIAEPPFDPAVKRTDSDESSATIEEMLGALGVVLGVEVDADVAADPVPATLTALTRT